MKCDILATWRTNGDDKRRACRSLWQRTVGCLDGCNEVHNSYFVERHSEGWIV
jgi:hypothetical protein